MLRSLVLSCTLGAVALGSALAQAPAAPAATFKLEEIEQLVAPIALYPDALLAQVLMASTYPLEVVEAARWAKANPGLKEKALEDALQQQGWDASVKSLAAFPQVLAMMNDKLDWTQKLGDAFLAQQKDVMDAAQRLRKKAQAAGNLNSGKEQKVTTEQDGGTTVIKVEPASSTIVYVPTYNPMVVYGPWPYPAYPPYYYYPPGYSAGGVFFAFSVGIIVGNAMWGGCHWGHGNVYVNVNHYNNFNKTNISNGDWNHKAEHRKGVQYRDSASREKFGQGQRPGVDSREQFRGRAEQGRQDIARGGADSFKRDGSGREAGAFQGAGQGAQTRDFSNRGASSRGGMSRSGGGGGRRR